MRRLVLVLTTSFIGLFGGTSTAAAHGNDAYLVGVLDCDEGGLAFGQPVQVLWGTAWYDATVLAVAGPNTLVHYTGWSSSWDEWVTPGRLRLVLPAGDVEARGQHRVGAFANEAEVVVAPERDEPYVWSQPHNRPPIRVPHRWGRARPTAFRFAYFR